jgi:hypothetical protein
MKRFVTIVAVLVALLVLSVATATAHTKVYKTSMTFSVSYDQATEIATAKGRISSPLAACVKGREISLSVLPDYESGTTVKAKADGSFEWKYHTTLPEGDEVSAFADVDVLERTQNHFHKCGKASKKGPVA